MSERIAIWIGTKSSLLFHTLLFIVVFVIGLLHLAPWDTILLVLTTAVSLEAIYLAIFIQMTVNLHAASLKEVEEDIGEIQKDVDEIQEDVDEIQEDVDEIQEDVGEIQKDVDAIEEDVDGIQEDVGEEDAHETEQRRLLADMSENLERLLLDIEKMKKELHN